MITEHNRPGKNYDMFSQVSHQPHNVNGQATSWVFKGPSCNRTEGSSTRLNNSAGQGRAGNRREGHRRDGRDGTLTGRDGTGRARHYAIDSPEH